jgi:hypothetical protein
VGGDIPWLMSGNLICHEDRARCSAKFAFVFSVFSWLAGAAGVQAYGIGVPKTEEENRGVHGNERIESKQLGLFVRYTWAAVLGVAAP